MSAPDASPAQAATLARLTDAARVHIFDIDHTLTRRSTVLRFAVAAVRDGVVPPRRLLRVPFYWFAYRGGTLPLESMTAQTLSLGGLSRSRLERIAGDAWERRGRADMLDGAVAHIEALRAAGRRILLATSSLDIVVAPLVAHVGSPELIATELEFDGPIATGAFAGPATYREAKATRIAAWLEREAIAAADVAFYSDSINDLASLELAGYPVPTNPDPSLQAIARERGWPVIIFA